ncbi:PREDICTED: pentatricopeptide repeat-containing protein At5g27460 isoform X1 [Nelumbo nucifera]|uniref:Pentatricopeptide repeat-containing protein At5g27460 isoform X1 n=1 Tax=Nelumbo nucifera TaxID=4432 RepID=A0A1U8AKP5_NELNU|nr:PREDICTED: pentatricopeptide repeat-containing protein At5g27460 isoform X1 [Nelumbo nucifera]
MAMRSFIAGLRRKCGHSPPSQMLLLEETRLSRSLSSGPLRSEPLEESPSPVEDLKSRIFRLRLPKRSATTAIQKWVSEGNTITLSELRQISRELRKSQRYKHALEISEWMVTHQEFELSDSDYAVRIDLMTKVFGIDAAERYFEGLPPNILTWMGAQDIFQMSGTDHALRLELTIKVHGVAEAEEYFENILNTNSKKAACFSLLHCYVKERATKKAEALMLKIQELGLAVNPHLFNEMMKLYMATRLFENVPSVIQQMKENKIPLNVLSYNLWMNACAQLSGVTSAEMVYKEMMNDKNVEVGWSSHCTLANIYIRSGLVDNAIVALRAAEQKLSTQKRLGYFFLITQYSALNNKEEVLRLWEASKSVAGKITCANYMCILLCLVKVGGIEEAEKVFRVWESQCVKYDIRVSNVLLGAYMRNGWMDKAESLHLHTLKKGGYPNYKTWEILMEGWLKSQEMDKAVEAMKKGFAMLKHCDWRPSPKIIMSISEYFVRHGDFENAKKYVKVIRQLGLMSLQLYKSLLRMHIHAGRPALDILKMMEKDKIDMDEEVYSLVECVSK